MRRVEILYDFTHSNIKYFIVRYLITNRVSIFCNLIDGEDIEVVSKSNSLENMRGLDFNLLNDLCDTTKRSLRHHINKAVLSMVVVELNYLSLDEFTYTLNNYLRREYNNVVNMSVRNNCGVPMNVRYETCLVPSFRNKVLHNFKVFIGDTVEVILLRGKRVKGVVIKFSNDMLELSGNVKIPLVSIKDINIIIRKDGGNWR